jgi:uncharacterized tellurite resistance protein B-like protein
MNIKKFYVAIGKLLYAVADADSVITKQEKEELYHLITSRLTHREHHTDQFGTNDAWYAAFEFEAAEEQGMTANQAFREFADFIRENNKMMTEDMKEICMILADRLAESYHHTNQREQDMIRKLKEVLYTIHPVNPENV